MIPKLQERGSSFKGLATYLTHDPKAETDKRVDWTHTLNLAHDDVPSAVDEMLWTYRQAELLKQEAGIRAGGREAEDPVKHFSLNWSPEDSPTRKHMIETAEDFLRHMKWHEHQALLVAHNDKAYAHVHVMLNVIHPETGLCLNESFEQRRAQAWAAEYEREQGRIYCEQRLLDPEQREDAPTRPMWMAFRGQEKDFEREENSRRDNEPVSRDGGKNPNNPNFEEWRTLKEIQKQQRLVFFAEGKLEFSELRGSIYREIREEYREQWADFYSAQKNGGDAAELSIVKAELIAAQNAALETRRDEACKELRQSRDISYRELLDDQREIRAGLRQRQGAGLDNEIFLRLADERKLGRGAKDSFRDATNETTAPREESNTTPGIAARTFTPREKAAGFKSGADSGARVAEGLGFGLISFFESIADGLIGSTPAPKPREPEPEPSETDTFDAVIDDARKRQQQERELADEEWRKRQRSAGD